MDLECGRPQRCCRFTCGQASSSDENQLIDHALGAAEDEPPIEQVGEDTGEDVETLDEAAPPADEVDTTEDIELLDQGPPAKRKRTSSSWIKVPRRRRPPSTGTIDR